MAKNILVIGAGAGIGLATARKFRQEGFGVGLVARNLERIRAEAQALGGHAYAADAGDFGAMRGVVAQAEHDLGGLDVLLYNAVASNWQPLAAVSSEQLVQDFRVNVGGAHAAVLAAHTQRFWRRCRA